MAEGILRKLLADKGYTDVEVASAGVGTLDGYPATPNAVEVSSRRGIDISHHHSTRITAKLFQEYDLVFAMADNHYERLSEFPGAEERLYLVKSFPEKNQADAAHSVDDPLGGTLEEYIDTFEEIEREITRALPDIIRRIDNQ